jgi:hypothetical protein
VDDTLEPGRICGPVFFFNQPTATLAAVCIESRKRYQGLKTPEETALYAKNSL